MQKYALKPPLSSNPLRKTILNNSSLFDADADLPIGCAHAIDLQYYLSNHDIPRTLEKEQKHMAQDEHVSLIKKGAEAWDQWRQNNSEVQPDLYSTNLRNIVCRNMDLSGATLSVAILNRADFSGAKLRQANISSANLTEAILCGADLHGADCRGTNFTRTDLSGANLTGVDLRSGLLVGANLQDANLSGANLSSTLMQTAQNVTIEQLASAQTLWLTELGERVTLVQEHCPHLLERPTQ